MTAPQRSTDAGAPPGGVRVHASLPAPPKRSPAAILLSALLHLLLIALALRLTAAVVAPKDSPLGDAIMNALGGGGGGGQGGTAYVSLAKPPPPPPPAPAIVPPVVTPKVLPAEHVTEPVLPPQPVTVQPAKVDSAPPGNAVASAGTGGGTGGGTGTGNGTGTGSGEGPGSGSGKGGGTGGGDGGFPPEPKQMILPEPHAPKSLRGVTINVTFTIDTLGQVVGLKVAPPIADRSYAERFENAMRGYRFKPGRDASGKHVVSTFPIAITVGS